MRSGNLNEAKGAYSLLETLIAIVILVVFVVLSYSVVFRHPSGNTLKKPQTAEGNGAPERKADVTHPDPRHMAESPPVQTTPVK